MGIKDLDGKDVVNTALRLAATLYEPQTRISKGTYKTLEGIVDYGAGLVGGIGGLFNKDFQDNVRKFIEVDAVGKMWDGLGLSKVEEMSYVNELGFAGEVGREVAEGVGGMLPSLALSLIPGVGPAIGTAVTGVSAGGKSMESALAKGAGYGNSLAYGTIAGVAEGAIEKLGGAVLGEGTSLVGKALAGTALGNATSKGLGKVAMTFASEAGEELLSDVIDPLNSFVTGVDKNIGENYKETFKPENLLKTAIVGGTVGSVMQGGNVAMNASKNKATGRGGLKATFADDSAKYIQEVSKNYGNDAVKNAKYDKAIAMSLNEISKNITKLDEGSRANYLNSIGPLKNAFDDKGNVKSTAMAKDVNQEAISSNLRAISGTVKYAPVKSSETISEGAKNVKGTIEKVIGEGANVVITNDSVSGDALFNPDDDVIYVNNKANITQKSLAYAIGLHEVTHATEGTEAYVELMNTLEELTKDEKTPQEVLDIIGDIRLRKLKTAFAYRKDLEERGEKSAKYLIDTEVGSDLMGDLLGNDYFIEKLAHRNDSLVKKMYHSITSLIKRKNTDLSKDSIKYLNKLASKFARAIDNRRGGVKLSDIGAMDDEREENESNERFTYGGIKARTADKLPLARAKQMLEEGVDAETIRKETGWFKGYDGKWRFEIDDSKMKVNLNTSKYTTLEKLIEHDALFEAYPELRQIGVTFSDLDGYSGGYNRTFGDIELDISLKSDAERMKKTLIHEIQHAIQDIESFARGASPEYWDKKIADGYDSRQAYVKEQESSLYEEIKKKRHENRDFIEDIEFLVDSIPNKPRGKVDLETWEQIEEDPPEWKSFDRKRDALVEKYGTDEVYHYMDVFEKLKRLKNEGKRYGYDLYSNTAGEIEARDVSKRVDLETGQRKNIRPDIDQEDVVFAEDFVIKYYSKEESNSSITEQLRNKLYDLNQIEPVVTVDISKKTKNEVRIMAIEEFKKFGYKVDRQNFGIIELGEKEINRSFEYLNTSAECAAIFAVPKVLKRGIIIDGHKNHKSRNFPTITIAAPIVINGTRANMAVVVQLTKGNRYKTHRILMPDGSRFVFEEIKKNIEPTYSNLRVENNSQGKDISSMFNNSIHENSEKINTFDKKSDLNVKKDDNRYSRRTTGDDLDVDFVKDEDGSIRITTNDLERAQKLEKKRRNNSGEDKLEVAEEQRKESLRGLIGEEVIEEVSASNEVTRLRKYIADNMHLKKYDSKDAIAIIDELMGIIELSDEKNPVFAKLKGKKQTEVKRMLVDALNTKEPGERNGVALEIARYLIYNTTITDAYESNEDVGLALNIIETLKPYLHGINLDNIKGEINVKYDKNKSAYAMWSKKNGERGVSADMVAQALEDELGIKVEAINEADIFLELDDMYRNAKRVISESIPEKSILGDVLNSKEAHELEQKLAREILLAYDKYGKETKFSKLQQRYEGKISDLTKRLKDAGIRNTLENRILKEIQKLKDSKNGKYANATQHHTEALNGIKSLLSKINSREQINRSSTREILSMLDEWYTDDNPILTNNAVKDDKNKENKGFYSSAVKVMLSYFKETVEYVENGEGEAVKKAEKPLTITELEMVNKVLAHVNHVIENYGKIFRFGKYVEARDISSEMQGVLLEAKENQSGFASMLQRSLLTRAATIKWAQYFSDVELVMSQWDGHEDGFFSQSYRELVLGLIGQKADEMEILREYNEFERTHKKYMKKLKSDKNTINVTFTVNTREGTIKDINIPRYAAIDLYMVSKTGEVMKTLEETGWYLDTDESQERKDANPITKEQIKELEKQFTEEDRELIKILEKAYNEDCKKLKHNTDMKSIGFSNIIAGYYYPTHRISSTSIDSNEMLVEMERVSNISANKSRVKGAKNAIIVGNCLTKFKRHVNAVTRYANLSIPIENINVLLNLDTNDNPNKPTSIRTMIESSKMWSGAIDYLRKLADDVQQVGIKDDVGGKIISFLRGSFAKYQLGANPKVWFSQLSSYLAAYGELRFTSLARAGTIKGAIKDSDVDKYCQLAAIRHYEMGATKAMAVSERIGAVGELLSKPIEAVDRGVIKMLFAACQAEAESVHKLKVGTEENKIKAGEILERVILRTQQNQLVTEQSAAMRSKSEFVRAFTMFNADSMKMVSRWLQSVGELSTLSRKLKKAKERGDTKRIEEHNTRIKKARKSLAKYSAAIIAISAYMTLLAKGFKLLYNKDDEEPFWDWFFGGIWDNMIGMLPLVRDVYSYYNDGYEVDTFLTETVNNVLSSTKQTMDMFGDLVDGKAVPEQDIAKNTKALVYAIGQVFGIPYRNMYNFATGITRRINDGAGLAVDSFFQEPSEANIKDKLSKAISEGDSVTERVSIDLLLSNRDISIEDNILKKEMDRLIKLNLTKEETDKNDYSPFSRKIPEILTIDGEEVEISTKDRNTFKTGLKTAERDNAKMVKTLMYKKLDDESKAYCLRVVYNFHHQSSMASTSDEAKTRLVYFGGSVDINILALIMAFAKDAKSDARQSRREKIEAYVRSFGLSPVKASLALRCVGYSDKERDGMVERYINSMRGLSKEERDEFLHYAKIG